MVCHNSLSEVEPLTALGVSLYRQPTEFPGFPAPSGPAWKLYPPRLRREAHEIIMDNDLVIHEKSPQIDSFLAGSHFLATRAIARCFSVYDSLVSPDVLINSGLVGLPPHFDYAKELKETLLGSWNSHFDEQGLVAACITRHRYELLNLSIKSSIFDIAGEIGTHFIGANGGDPTFYSWCKSTTL